MRFWFKTLTVPASNETKEIEAVQLWAVRWSRRYGSFHSDTEDVLEAFTSKDEAETFRNSLVAAFKLIRHTGGCRVTLEKME